MKLLFATGNNKKYELMKNRLKDINQIEVLMPRQIGENSPDWEQIRDLTGVLLLQEMLVRRKKKRRR